MAKDKTYAKYFKDRSDKDLYTEYIKLCHGIKIGDFACSHLKKADKIKQGLENRGYRFNEDEDMIENI